MGGLGGGGLGGLGQQFGGMNGGGGRRGISNRGVGVQQSIRPMIVFSNIERVPTLAPIAIAQNAVGTFSQAQNFTGLKEVTVNVDDGGIATLRGTAVTAHDRSIAAAMLAMQPGVRSVQNQMVVPPSSTLPPIARPSSPPNQ